MYKAKGRAYNVFLGSGGSFQKNDKKKEVVMSSRWSQVETQITKLQKQRLKKNGLLWLWHWERADLENTALFCSL